MKEEKRRTVWDDIASQWKKIAAVIAAIGVITTFIVNLFNTPADKTLICTSIGGFALLVLSWYVDKQAQYSKADLLRHEKDSQEIVSQLTSSLNELKAISFDTRKDTLRIQLSLYIKSDETNIDTILKIAETYFVILGGDWYMTNEFTKWAKKHDVIVPPSIFDAIKDNHNKEDK